MRAGSVLVDVAIDQGGIAETSRATSHSAPLYVEERVVQQVHAGRVTHRGLAQDTEREYSRAFA